MQMTHAAINLSLSGEFVVVSNPDSPYRINVYELFIVAENTVNLTLVSTNYGSGTGVTGAPLTGPMHLARSAPIHWPLQERANGVRVPHFQTEFGDSLIFRLGSAVQISGYIKYTIESLGDA